MHPLLRLVRPLTSLMIGLAVFASAFVGAGGGILAYSIPVSLAVLAAFFFGCAGNVINDYFDLESDRINHPERPLPSGEVTQSQALQIALGLFFVSWVLAAILGLTAGYKVLIVVVVASLLQMAYEIRLKREKIIGNWVIGFQTALAFVFGGLVVKNTEVTGILAGLAFISIVGREIVKDIEDMRGDVGKNSLPLWIGAAKSGAVASLLLLLAVAGSTLPYVRGIFGKSYLATVVVADLIFIASLPLIITNPGLARRTIKVGMLVAMTAFIVGRIFA